MTGTRYCVTNTLERLPRTDRPRPCLERVRDETTGRMVPMHYAHCVDPTTCPGCVPREATHGYLCDACYAKVVDALGRVGNLILHLRSIDRAGQALAERVDTSSANRMILPESWLSCDGLLEALGSPPVQSTTDLRFDRDFRELDRHIRDALDPWVDVDEIVNTREGSKRAVVLVKRVQQALKRWPDAEVDWRHIPLMLCVNCGQATLYRKGPLHYEDDLLIECAESTLVPYLPGEEDGTATRTIRADWAALGYASCQWQMDWFQWLNDYQRPIEAAFAIHRKRWEAA